MKEVGKYVYTGKAVFLETKTPNSMAEISGRIFWLGSRFEGKEIVYSAKPPPINTRLLSTPPVIFGVPRAAGPQHRLVLSFSMFSGCSPGPIRPAS